GGMNLLAYFIPNAPLPSFRRRDRARVEVERLLANVMVERRRRREQGDETEYEDFLQTLMDSHYEDGTRIPDHVIAGLLLTLIFEGKQRSAVRAGWLGVLLHKNRQYLPGLVKEIDQFLEGGEITRERLMQCSTLELCVIETEGLRPPLVMLMRAVLKD